MDFIAVDFETPNRKNNSICAMGITFVKNSQIEFHRSILINPDAPFSGANMEIHGITKDMVCNAPLFPQVWSEYQKYFNHYSVVMHNVPFDTNVLSKTAARYGIALPPMDFFCTMQLWKENRGNGSAALNVICEELGLTLTHHDPGSDSLCTAKVMLSLLEDERACIHTYMDAEMFANRHYERVEEGFQEENREDSFVIPDCHYYDGELQIAEKKFVLTGVFPGLDRATATAFIEAKGGRVMSGVSKKTDYLIVGLEDTTVVGTDQKSTKIEKAEVLIAQGASICIVPCEKLMALLQEEK